ncbi:hypothetical protein [Sporosarcina ureilytica]|uniref:Uncharacterized protein n=1 Tax=Sporosarcina ureilytica TaxID=298596 RepID=A0A1D8JBV6_9BACL|nr:hypothetical protein [Sporosarcina ureilytica]AOV06188.1 hypothetical protein BI350_00070 [Sporosarcina ureilytica]
MNGRLFWVALLFISGSWIVNTLYAQSKQLQEPIFLEHAIDTVVYEGSNLTFYYLTNTNDSSVISSINLNGIRGYALENESAEPIQTFPYYSLRQVHIQMDPFDIENSLQDEPLTTNTAVVLFNDGKMLTTSIGEVTLRSEDQVNHTLTPIGGSGGNDWSMNWYEAEDDLTIESFSIDVSEAFQKFITVKIDSATAAKQFDPLPIKSDEQDIPGIHLDELELPIEINKGENLYIYWAISPQFFGSIQSSLTLSGTTASGHPFTDQSPLYSQPLYLDNKDLQKIIQAKENAR